MPRSVQPEELRILGEKHATLGHEQSQVLLIVGLQLPGLVRRQDIDTPPEQPTGHRSRHVFIHVEADPFSHEWRSLASRESVGRVWE